MKAQTVYLLQPIPNLGENNPSACSAVVSLDSLCAG